MSREHIHLVHLEAVQEIKQKPVKGGTKYLSYSQGRYLFPLFLSKCLFPVAQLTSLGLGDTCSRILN